MKARWAAYPITLFGGDDPDVSYVASFGPVLHLFFFLSVEFGGPGPYPYRTVQTGPNTHGGGRRGGCFKDMYVVCVADAVGDAVWLVWAREVLGRRDVRRVANPTAVPRAMGKRMDEAGCSSMAEGMVMEGM